LRIGYAKALELIQQLEQEGAIASGDPGASREVLVKSGSGQEPS
jgi:DNA segregation ATPase FtsK/SpoIIIE-like protein